ncbi:hypothetical protein AX17_002565 [Amanita inopinata Kibby_2008]|nr:hypothetical protein AX17_002565 [Amanita inopinata Kibby_2008]
MPNDYNALHNGYNTRSKARRIKELDSQLDTRAPRHHPRIHEKLPAEVMQLIFEMCAPPNHIIHIPLIRRLRELIGYTLVLISHICSAWRTLVLDMPRLWSHVRLDLHPPSYKNIDAAQTLLSRATRHSGDGTDPSPSLMIESNALYSLLDEHDMKSL